MAQGNSFWKGYSEIFNKHNLNSLLEIKKILETIKNKKSYLIEDLGFINKYIHETGIEMSLNGKFNNNIEILDFIKNKDIYYSSKIYINSRDLNIFAGLILSMDENERNEFLKIWKSINFNEMFNEEQYNEFQKVIIFHISHISLFHLLFELFGDFNENISNYKNIIPFKNKYNSLIQLINNEYLINLNDTFIEDSANLIYLLEEHRKIGKSFIQNDLINKLPLNIIIKIFFKFMNKFKEIHDDIIDEIATFF